MSKGKYYFSKSLEKGLKILDLFNRESPVLTQTQIAKTLGLNMTSTYRYINTLVELGYLNKNTQTKEITTSINCLRLYTNLMQATDHLKFIKEVVDRIHAENNLSIEVVYAIDDTLVRIYNREAEEMLTYSLPDYSRNCLHNTALGKAFLTSLPSDEVRNKIETMDLIARTVATITDPEVLWQEVQAARNCGFTMSNEEYLPGLLAIGAPLIDPESGRGVGAVSFDFSVLQHSATEVQEKYSEMVRNTAHTLSDLLPPTRGLLLKQMPAGSLASSR